MSGPLLRGPGYKTVSGVYFKTIGLLGFVAVFRETWEV